jgi:lipoate-protein ligase A
MYDFDIGLIEKCVRMPPRQPDYREGRSHANFLANLPATSADLRAALVRAWQATTPIDAWPEQEMSLLAEERYNRDEWTLSRFDER